MSEFTRPDDGRRVHSAPPVPETAQREPTPAELREQNDAIRRGQAARQRRDDRTRESMRDVGAEPRW